MVLPIAESWVGRQQRRLLVAVILTVMSGVEIVRRGYVDWQRDK